MLLDDSTKCNDSNKFNDNSFEVIVCSGVMSYIDDIQNMFNEY
jgi:ubiquinone/menaquinone biosynthesis C-methylase UbiE